MSDDRIIELLIRDGLITAADVAQAKERQALHHGPNSSDPRSLLQILVDLEFIESEDLARRAVPRESDRAEGHLIQGYKLCNRIGRGGMGDVYLGVAEEDVHGKGDEVAIKLLPHRLAHDAEYLARFRREVLALSAANHPHITRFIAEGLHEGRPLPNHGSGAWLESEGAPDERRGLKRAGRSHVTCSNVIGLGGCLG